MSLRHIHISDKIKIYGLISYDRKFIRYIKDLKKHKVVLIDDNVIKVQKLIMRLTRERICYSHKFKDSSEEHIITIDPPQRNTITTIKDCK